MTKEQELRVLVSILGDFKSYDNKDNYVFHCPSCNHRSPHLAVQLVTQKYHCFICEFSGIGHENSLRRLGFYRQSKLFSEKSAIYKSFSKEYVESLIRGDAFSLSYTQTEDLFVPAHYEYLYKNRYKFLFNVGYNYLMNRGLNDDDLLKYNIHYSVEERRVLIPSFNCDFKLNYYITRSVDDDVYSKYLNPKSNKTSLIFNEFLIDWSSELLLVEGVFDAILSRKNSVPLLGSSLNKNTKLFREIKKNNTPVILALDPDALGKQCKIAELLFKNNISVCSLDMSKEKGDVAEIGCDRLDSLISSSSSFDFTQLVQSHMITGGRIENSTHSRLAHTIT